MMVVLVLNVSHNLWQVLGAERQGTVLGLPRETRFATASGHVIDEMAGRAFEFPDNERDRMFWRNRYGYMNVIGHDRQGMEHESEVKTPCPYAPLNEPFQAIHQHRISLRSRPHDVVEQSPVRQISPQQPPSSRSLAGFVDLARGL